MQNISYGEFNKINSINFTSEYGKLKNIKLEGSTTQATRSGKNLFEINDISINNANSEIKIVDNRIIITALGTVGEQYAEKIVSALESSKNYTFSFKAKKTVLGTDGLSIINITVYGSNDGSTYIFLKNLQNTAPVENKEYYFQETFTGYSSYKFFIYNNADTPVTIGEQTEYYDIQLEEGSTVTDYEQYGASPSPDYPSPIENVEGKNKFSGWVKGKGLDLTTGAEINSNTAATSDYIPVNFNNRAYTISGLTNTLFSYIAIYNSQKQFLGRTGASNYSNLTAYSNSFTSGTSQGTRDIAYVRVTTYENSGVTGKIDDIDNLETQLEEGTVATSYVPYNSLEIKNVGENLFNISKVQNVNDDVSNCTLIEKNANGVKIQGATSTATDIFAWSKGWYCPGYSKASKEAQVSIKEPCTIKLSADVTLLETVTEPRIRMNLRKVNGDAILADSTVLNLNKKTRIETTFKVNPGKIFPFFALCSNTFLIENIMISTTGGEYKPYQEQKVDFPLSEGQKLMEGSYLADDGIHHSRKQVVFDGSEIFTIQPQTNETNLYIAVKITDLKPNSVLLSNYFTSGLKLGNNIGIGALFQNYLYFGIPLTTIGATAEDDNSTKTSKFKTWLSTHNLIVEYELAEPEIVPYTAEQQEAWNKIKNFPIFIGQNNLTSTALLSAIYIKKITTDTKVDYNLYNEDYIKIATKNNIHPKFKIQMLDEYENVIDEITGDISRDNSGSISNNYQQGVRRSVSLTFIDTEGKFLPDSNSNLIWANKKFKLFSGLLDTDTNEIFWFSEGIYYFSNVSSSRNGADKLTTVNGVDKFGKFGSELGYNQLESTYLIPAGTKIYDAIKGILNIDIGNGYPIDPIEPVLDPLYIDEVCPYDISKSPSSYLSEMLIELADIIGCDIYYDADGRLHVDSGTIDFSYSNRPSIWDFSDVLPEYMNPSITTNFAEFINTVKVVGNNTNDKTYEYTAVNNNPESPTRVDLIGTKSTYIESASVYNTDRAKDYAEYKLNMFSILQLAVTFSCTFLPHLDVNKVITITDSYYKYEKQRFVIQSITLPLSYDGVMSISACNVASLPYYEGGN